jgi:hypothetical protein
MNRGYHGDGEDCVADNDYPHGVPTGTRSLRWPRIGFAINLVIRVIRVSGYIHNNHIRLNFEYYHFLKRLTIKHEKEACKS